MLSAPNVIGTQDRRVVESEQVVSYAVRMHACLRKRKQLLHATERNTTNSCDREDGAGRAPGLRKLRWMSADQNQARVTPRRLVTLSGGDADAKGCAPISRPEGRLVLLVMVPTQSMPRGVHLANARGALHRPHPAGFISPMPVGLCTSHARGVHLANAVGSAPAPPCGVHLVNARGALHSQRPWGLCTGHTPRGSSRQLPVGLCTSHTPRGSSRQRSEGSAPAPPCGVRLENARGALHSQRPWGSAPAHTPRGSSRRRPWGSAQSTPVGLGTGHYTAGLTSSTPRGVLRRQRPWGSAQSTPRGVHLDAARRGSAPPKRPPNFAQSMPVGLCTANARRALDSRRPRGSSEPRTESHENRQPAMRRVRQAEWNRTHGPQR